MSLVHELEDAILLEEQYSPVSLTIQGNPYKSQLPSSSWSAGPRFLRKRTTAQSDAGEDEWSGGLFLLGPRTTARLPGSRQCGTSMRTDIQVMGQNQGSRKPLHLQSMDFNKDVKTIQLGGNSLFSKRCWDMQLPTGKRMKSNPLIQGSPVPGCTAGGKRQEGKWSSTYCTPRLEPPPGPHLTLSRRNRPTKPVPGSKMVGDHCRTSQHMQKLTPMLHRPEYEAFREKSKHLWFLAAQWFLVKTPKQKQEE